MSPKKRTTAVTAATVTATTVSAVAVATGSLVAALALAPTGAAAAPTCTAWGSLPARVALADHPVTVHMTLRGTSGCDAGGVDNGATATLRGPGANDPQRWSSFGAQDTQTFTLRVNALGTYTLRDGNVQVYDANEERVAAQWRTTSVVVERASRVRDLQRDGGTLRAQVQSYAGNGWRAASGSRVLLEKRTGSGWRPVVQESATRSGRVEFTGLTAGARYRLVAGATRGAWGATSRTV